MPAHDHPRSQPAGAPAHEPRGIDATTDLSSSDQTAPPAAGPLPPAPADRYRLLAEIARGGMGVVWSATDATLGREVAVKVLHDRYGSGSGAARRFADEASITARLQHPAIPPVHDYGTLPDGRPFLAMKLIRGRTFDDLLQQRGDPAADRGRFVAVFEQVCQAVAYAHAHKVIHRDLKPSNVMVGSFGEVQVMDWGLAKVLSGAVASAATGDTVDGEATPGSEDGFEVSFTQAGSVLGTLAYMAPEQAAGEVGKVGPRSDVFGLGAMLAVILTGQPPYTGEDTRAVRVMALRGDLAACLARLDVCGGEPELVGLCKRCLAFDPAGRPADAGAVAEEVAGFRVAAEERARTAEKERAAAEVKAAEQKKRRRVQRALGLTVGLLIAGAGTVAWWGDRQAGERRADALRREVEDQRRAEAERDRLARNAQAVESLLAQCEDALRADDADKAAVHLDLAGRGLAEGGAEGLRPRFDRLAADLAVLRALDRLDELRWTETAGLLTGDADLSKEAAAAFRRYGLIPGETRPDAAARLVNGSPVRERLLTALDLWLGWARPGDGATADGLAAILLAADPDPYRGAVRDTSRADQQPALRQLGEQPEALTQPTWFATVLGQRPAISADRREQILRAAHVRHPNDLNVLITLSQLYPFNEKDRAAERVGWCRAAVAARPGSALAWNLLGVALGVAGDLPGAEAAFREALRLDPTTLRARSGLGNVLLRRGDLAGAEAAFREVVRLNPTLHVPHYNLALVLLARKDRAGAEAEFREAARLDPKYGPAYTGLGETLRLRGDLDGAIAAFREVTRINPKNVSAFVALGTVLLERGDLDEAAGAFREAARLEPGNQRARTGLQQAERLLALLPRLPGLAAGRERPGSPAEAVEIARLCATPSQGRYAVAVRLYAGAFADDPKLADDPNAGHRFAAARSAVLAAAGMDRGLPGVEPAERSRLTGLALGWLRADLARMTDLARDAKWRQPIWERLTRWKEGPELAPVRDPAALAALPSADGQGWQSLWRDVDALLGTVTN